MNLDSYPAPIVELLGQDRLMELGPGSPNRSMKSTLQSLNVDELFPNAANRELARACISGLWLYHDFLDESHAISQDLPSATGSYWHGIMHRREPDASNAKYWFRRVGDHPIFESLTTEANQFDLPLRSERWDPFHFIDLCEQHRGTGTQEEMTLRQLQRKEWELLFDWCYQGAKGKE